ncbi:MAG: 50S ribosomal protein L1 [Nitrososphaeria archaeon]|nr:50S ribosomal protein L1 [Aigarchaeota archaeon]MCX8187253.1 50S ribosomal protein L1 [Nitrososphaeria archaeon]MDW8021940.1 50S ribosomal protein L1 [Nitrososphaerota archaeon]
MLKSVEASIVEAVEKAKNLGKPRKFKQSIELIINIKGIDFKKPENRIYEVIELPHGCGNKPSKICVIASPALAAEARKIPEIDRVIEREELEALTGNKRLAKKVASKYDFFLVDPTLMGLAAKALGAALGGRGKRPQPIPQGVDLAGLVKSLKKSIIINVRKNPQAMCLIGTEDMDSRQLAENAAAVISKIVDKFEKRLKNVQSIYVKKTMAEPVKVEFAE